MGRPDGYTNVVVEASFCIEGGFNEASFRADLNEAMLKLAREHGAEDVAVDLKVPVLFWTSLSEDE